MKTHIFRKGKTSQEEKDRHSHTGLIHGAEGVLMIFPLKMILKMKDLSFVVASTLLPLLKVPVKHGTVVSLQRLLEGFLTRISLFIMLCSV